MHQPDLAFSEGFYLEHVLSVKQTWNDESAKPPALSSRFDSEKLRTKGHRAAPGRLDAHVESGAVLEGSIHASNERIPFGEAAEVGHGRPHLRRGRVRWWASVSHWHLDHSTPIRHTPSTPVENQAGSSAVGLDRPAARSERQSRRALLDLIVDRL